MSIHINLEYIDWSQFDRAVKEAEDRRMMAQMVRAAGDFLETIFHNGDEPKWSHQCQRERALVLSEHVAGMAQYIGVISEDEHDRHVARLVKSTGSAKQ